MLLCPCNLTDITSALTACICLHLFNLPFTSSVWRKCITRVRAGLNSEQQEMSRQWLSVILWRVVQAEWRVWQTLTFNPESEGHNVKVGLTRSWHLVYIYMDWSNSMCLMYACGPFYLIYIIYIYYIFNINPPTASLLPCLLIGWDKHFTDLL